METEKVLDGLLDWLVNDCREDICKLCVKEDESNEEWMRSGQDIPEDVEPCIFKREGGCAACKKYISEFFSK